MPSVYPSVRPDGSPSLFGHVRDTNIVFVVDTSQSMQAYLSATKFHLKEALLAKAYTLASRFNIVEFSNKVSKWCDRVVVCTPQTVSSAVQWLQSLTCALGRDLLSALTAAFSDPLCQAIYLVTNGLPDNALKDILHVLPYISRGRPIHTFYLSEKWLDSEMREFLQGISRATQGSAHLIRLNHCGAIKQVIPIYPADHSISGPLYSDVKYCSVTTPLDKSPFIDSRAGCSDTVFYLHPVNAYSPRDYTSSICKYTDPYVGPLGSSHLTFEATVLARRESDGFFYLGTIKQEIRKGIFLIEFDKSTMDQDGNCQISVQETALYDIIQYNEGMRHSVVPGDYVLAPWESDGNRYGPGKVITGIETRDPLQAMEDDEISVKFWNGKAVTVSKNVAMWIPPAMYERVLQELLTPLLSRQQLADDELAPCRDVCLHRLQIESTCKCHFEPPCTQSWCLGFPGLDPCKSYWHGFYHGFHYLPVHHPCYCFPEVIPPAAWWPETAKCPNSTASDKDELDKKITLQLQELDIPNKKTSDENLLTLLSSSSSSEDSDSCPETTVRKTTLQDRAVNTDSLLKKTKIQVIHRPEWKYWSQSHQGPHQKDPGTLPSSPLRSASDCGQLKSSMQPQNPRPTNCSAMFKSVDHAYPLNRVTMKDILTQQKHHTTSPTGGAPIQERLGENQLSLDCQHQEAIQRSRKKKLQRRQWEKDREQQCQDKYQSIQENRREKVVRRLQNNFRQVEEREQKLEKTERAKQYLQQQTQARIQSIASEDKEREARRLAHLQQVTARKDMMEAEKMKADEIKEIQLQEARRKRVEQHNKMVAEKFSEAEKLI
ncbi:uncharacterized protein C11orf16 homolog isoform X3 [Hypanus sabinus]|uniref:uncharacterized protein C11orf16 homolog isoform X3 n=1 Tax=Hypanus sabinus TaxID=79690 RepID=UPI0028C3854E|nr:uncharacterized protein C11orf16 homolog isoform X3 [Hypanus sabinus]